MKITVILLLAFYLMGCQTMAFMAASPFRTSTGIAEHWKVTVGEVPGVEDVDYRIYQKSENPKRTIFFKHGYFSDVRALESSLFDEEDLVQVLEESGDVRVVVVSFGYKWMLTPYEGKKTTPEQSTLSNYTDKVIPYLEKTHNFKGPYTLIGKSMGGSNAATLCAARPEMWSECILVNPMLIPDRINPFTLKDNDQWKPSFVIKRQFDNLDLWKKYRPSELLKTTKNMPRTFVTACKEDGLGIFDGPEEWSKQAQELGLPVTWHPVMENCSHDRWPVKELLSFVDLNEKARNLASAEEEEKEAAKN